MNLNGLPVLVVEDDPDARMLFEFVLTHCGAAVRAAPSAREALAACSETPPALIVSDLGMPDMDGFELLEALRASEARDIPVIAVTGFSDYSERARTAGFSDFLTKPVDPSILCERVARHARPSDTL
jgi:CheY-like chemotaxis protein